ncbi:LAFA_0E02322g1_1 [Lachancea sp. 'fantastica']|nr:LAFA_0E02322g1_1 [Lachancea sp. 'fantastica']
MNNARHNPAMDTTQVVARSELYNEDNDSAPSSTELDEDMIPKFEFVTVNQTGEVNGKEAGDGPANEEEEFDFPLFSFGGSIDVSNADSLPNNEAEEQEQGQSRGRNTRRLIKVSLREESPDFVKQERPRSYYFADYSQDDIKKFESSAINYQVAVREHTLLATVSAIGRGRHSLNLDEHNKRIESDRLRELKIRRRRPGKKQREARKQGAERVKQRLENAKEIKKLVKKKFHKRGGKKNQKTSDVVAKQQPRFRTE